MLDPLAPVVVLEVAAVEEALRHLDLTCLNTISIPQNKQKSYLQIPRRALKAGSTRPPLARNTALTTAASIEGKASLNVFSACCSGASGRGGLGGGTSSPAPDVGFPIGAPGFKGEEAVSVVSSSKSKAFAVVGDSGRGSGFCCLLVGAYS